jgi:hypothetical protein
MYFNVNCRLLEKEKRLRSGLLDLEMQTHRGSQKKRRDPVTSHKISEVSNKSESVR